MKLLFTVCNRYLLPYAITLGESIRQHNPDQYLVLGWVDPLPLPDLPYAIRGIHVKSVDIPRFREMTERYYDFELVAACIPFFGSHLLKNNRETSELIYVSPTTYFYKGLGPSPANAGSFMQLKPHRTSPVSATSLLDDKRILNIGMYNGSGWIIHPDGQQEKELFDWWCERALDRCHFNLCQGMCLEQLWLNYIPIYFNNTTLIRNPGWQFGLNDVPGSVLSEVEGAYQVDGTPLISVDFGGLETFHPVWSDHTGLVKNSTVWRKLRVSYRSQVRQNSNFAFNKGQSYGRPVRIKPFRSYRKKIVGLLDRLVDRIETFDLTYN